MVWKERKGNQKGQRITFLWLSTVLTKEENPVRKVNQEL
jgi:hypothetical protein